MTNRKPVVLHGPPAGPDKKEDNVRSDRTSGHGAGEDAEESRMQILSKADSSVVVLESALTIAESSELHEILLSHVRAMTPLTINAAEVEVIDTAGLQLVAATFCAAGERGLSVQIDSPSERFISAARLIGLDVLFGLEQRDQGT